MKAVVRYVWLLTGRWFESRPGSLLIKEVLTEGDVMAKLTSCPSFLRAKFSTKTIYDIPMLPAVIFVIAFLMAMSGTEARADESATERKFDEHLVEFHNQAVKLAGSLFLPKGEGPFAAVVFIQGAGPHSRKSYREVGQYFASHGIAALIYDKRGTGESGGVYESHRPYENLVNDALSAVAFLKHRHEIAKSQIGMWGLSQGAYISAVAASRTKDIQFVIAVGASVADGMMFYYRDNLFRLYGLSDTLRDIAEKAFLAQRDLHRVLENGFSFSSFVPRSYSPPDQYVHPAWSRVKQPVLAMWGQLDQNVPVGESVAGMKNSLAQANNEKWTLIILPKTNHSLGRSKTGVLKGKWRGYSPGALKTMTDWVHNVINNPSQIDKMKQVGVAPEASVLSRLASYETLRWYGNATVQSALCISFLICFLSNTIMGAGYGLLHFFRRRQRMNFQASNRVMSFKRSIGTINLLILVSFTIVTVLALDQLHPSCPTVLSFVPILGTVSTVATIALLILLAKTHGDHNWTIAGKIRHSLDVVCLILFVPFMFYWNLIGYRF